MRYLIPVALLLASCATPEPTYLADGRKGYTVDCSGSMNDWNVCLKKAGKICGEKGYDIVSTTNETGTVAYLYFISTTRVRTMQFACSTEKAA